MRVLVVYHNAELPGPKCLFEALGSQPDVELRVLGPERGLDLLRNEVLELRPRHARGYQLVTGSTVASNRHNRGIYRRGLLREIRSFRPDVIHIFEEALSPLALQACLYRDLLSRRSRVIFYGFESVLVHPRSNLGRVAWGYLRRRLDGGTYANRDGVLAIAAAGFPIDRVRVTGWPVPLDTFVPGHDTTLASERARPFRLGFVGRIERAKGLKTLLGALSQLPPNVQLVCIGDGGWRSEFQGQVALAGLEHRVEMVGTVDASEVARRMNAMDALVLPSEATVSNREQFGRVLVEAMACGVPVIGSSSGAIPEIIGDAGLIFAEGSASSLSDVIERLVSDPQLSSELARRGRRRAVEEFSCEAVAGRVADLYAEALTW